MIDNEVDEIYANQIMEEIDKISKPNTPVDFILSTIYQKMILKFGKPAEIAPAGTNPKFIFFKLQGCFLYLFCCINNFKWNFQYIGISP